jgi:plasmid stabilization system protein ParE
MADRLTILPEAREDLAEAFAWYEEPSPGLGLEFFRCLEACVDSIRASPRLYPAVHEEYRRALERRFPYAVFYEYAGSCITFNAIFDCAHDPRRWKDRIR